MLFFARAGPPDPAGANVRPHCQALNQLLGHVDHQIHDIELRIRLIRQERARIKLFSVLFRQSIS